MENMNDQFHGFSKPLLVLLGIWLVTSLAGNYNHNQTVKRAAQVVIQLESEQRALEEITCVIEERDVTIGENTFLLTVSSQTINALNEEIEMLREIIDTHVEDKLVADVTATGYTNAPDECDEDPDSTALGPKPNKFMTVAVSRDLSYLLNHCIYIEGIGYKHVTDRMHPQWTKRIDVFFGSKADAFRFGKRELRIIDLGTRDPLKQKQFLERESGIEFK